DDFIRRCVEHDLDEPVAQQIFKSVAGFAEFGFCKSHAAAFARTAYETAWLRLNYPAHYTCALLNAQPMGFYHPSVLVDDAKRHGVRVLPVDVTRSRARCVVEPVAVVDEEDGGDTRSRRVPGVEESCVKMAGGHNARFRSGRLSEQANVRPPRPPHS